MQGGFGGQAGFNGQPGMPGFSGMPGMPGMNVQHGADGSVHMQVGFGGMPGMPGMNINMAGMPGQPGFGGPGFGGPAHQQPGFGGPNIGMPNPNAGGHFGHQQPGFGGPNIGMPNPNAAGGFHGNIGMPNPNANFGGSFKGILDMKVIDDKKGFGNEYPERIINICRNDGKAINNEQFLKAYGNCSFSDVKTCFVSGIGPYIQGFDKATMIATIKKAGHSSDALAALTHLWRFLPPHTSYQDKTEIAGSFTFSSDKDSAKKIMGL